MDKQKRRRTASENKRFAAIADALADAGFTIADYEGEAHLWLQPLSGVPKGKVIVESGSEHSATAGVASRADHHAGFPDSNDLILGYVVHRDGTIPQIVAYFCRRAGGRHTPS